MIASFILYHLTYEMIFGLSQVLPTKISSGFEEYHFKKQIFNHFKFNMQIPCRLHLF